jgi:tetratricopeptide (TPR) repeat protein
MEASAVPYHVSSESDHGAEQGAGTAKLDALQHVISAIDRGDTLHGLVALECSPELRALPVVNSYLAYCMARERGQIREAICLCQGALDAEPRNPAHYLNLGRIFLQTGDKAKAIATFWKGISKASGVERGVPAVPAELSPRGHAREHTLILQELRQLGIRKRVAFPSLGRRHPLNRITGKLLAKIGVR